MMKKQVPAGAGCAVLLLAAVSSTAAAQGRENDTAPGDDVPLEEIVVSGYRHSLAHAIETKRQSEQVMEALVAEDIGKLPNNNVAEALQHLTGINVGFTAGGEGGTAFIRGIQTSPGASAVRVELNGNDMGGGRSRRRGACRHDQADYPRSRAFARTYGQRIGARHLL